MKKTMQLSLLLLLFYSITFAQITIDGDMSDWTASMQIDLPPRTVEEIQDSIDLDWDGVLDAIIHPALDIKDLYVSHDADYLYIRIDINEGGAFSDLEGKVDGNMQAAIELFIDTDVDTSTGLTWGWWLTSGDYWINLSVKNGWPGFETTLEYGINKFTGLNGSDSQWEEVAGAQCNIAVNLDDNIMEVAIPRAALGETNGDYESTGILVLAEDPTAGWNADIVPNDLGIVRNVYRYNQEQIIIDGDVSDWTSDMQFDVASNQEEGLLDSVDSDWDGVMDGIINPALDIKDVYVTHDDDFLYVRIDINEDGTITDLAGLVDGEYIAPIQLYFDTDIDSATGLTWGNWMNGGDFYVNLTDVDGNPGLETIEAHGILRFTGLNGNDESFEEVEGGACQVAINLDDNIIEVAVSRALIGETNGDFESTGILVFAEDPSNGWVNDVAPNDDGLVRNVYRYGRKDIVIDGDMSDWGGAMRFDIEPNMEEGLVDSIDSDWDGVMDGIINPALDIKDVYVSHNDEYLFVRVDINEDGTFTDLESLVDGEYIAPIQLYFDTDLDSATGLTWGNWLNGGDYYVNITDADGNPGLETTEPYGLLRFTGLNGNDESFEEVEGGACQVAINLDDNKIEVAIPRALIDEINGENESTGILVFAEDPSTEWVNDAAPTNDTEFRNVYNYGNPIGSVVGVEDEIRSIPSAYELSQNYPNPFNPSTTINYSVAKAGLTTVKVFNIIGEEVATLVNSVKSVGRYNVKFDASKLSSGMYIYQIQAGGFQLSKKMLLLK